MYTNWQRGRRGFTLVELLVVIAIISVHPKRGGIIKSRVLEV